MTTKGSGKWGTSGLKFVPVDPKQVQFANRPKAQSKPTAKKSKK